MTKFPFAILILTAKYLLIGGAHFFKLFGKISSLKKNLIFRKSLCYFVSHSKQGRVQSNHNSIYIG